MFDPEIHWSPVEPYCRFFADPFFLCKRDGEYNIIAEELNFKEDYGKITLLTFNESFQRVRTKIELDLQQHLSYPFIFTENNKTYIFPESGDSGKLHCYEYDIVEGKIFFLKTILDFPFIDPTILKCHNTYWIFGTLPGKSTSDNLVIYFSDNLLGPYKKHPKNPIKKSVNGSRPAGNFINVDGILYRPSQNCLNRYGESISIFKVLLLNETEYREELYMNIEINKKSILNRGIRTIHTINAFENIIVVDGAKRLFAPFFKIRLWLKRRFKNKN